MSLTSFCELRRKEVINLRDGARLGNICDMEIDAACGEVRNIIVPGPPRLFGLLCSDEELVIPFNRITKIGADTILVDVVL
ncbi:MAG: YlmC/YmxH family sporulation protein [Christensenellaceae bacterium]|nr:YlmC/YmxH family sporulation protein [Christensenellaceae bacterium]